MNQPPNIRSILDQIKTGGQLTRAGTLTRAKGEDGKEIEDTYELSFSSEEPYERYFGIEILGHKKTEVELDWLKAGSAPLLWQHDRSTVIGVVEKATIEGGRGKAVVRLGTSDKAREVLSDIAAGILKNVSVGYEVNAMELVKAGKDGPSTYRVTSWKPLEVSIVSIPADQTVGVGRCSIQPNQENPVNKHLTQFHEQPESGSGAAPLAPAAPVATDTRAAAPAAVINQDAERKAIERERARVTEIQKIADQHKVPDLATKAIADGVTVEAFQKSVLDSVHQKNLAQGGVFTGAPVGGLSRQDEKDLDKFSFFRAINLIASNKPLDGVEGEMQRQFELEARTLNLAPQGNLGIPRLLISRGESEKRNAERNALASQAMQRDAVSLANDAASVQQINLSTDFFGALRASLVCADAGSIFLTGLRGKLRLRKVGTGAVGAWEGESDDAVDANPAPGYVDMEPKRFGGYIDLTKMMLAQDSLDVEGMFRQDLLEMLAVAADQAGLAGSGSSGQPTGVLNTSGIGSVAIGTNGGAPTWAMVTGLEEAVETANALKGRLHYITNAKVRRKLKNTVVGTDMKMIWPEKGNEVNGYLTLTTTNVPSNLTKGSTSGTCSAMIFGDWRRLVIGQWGGLDLLVDPYTRAAQAELRIHAHMFVDVGVRQAEAFAACKDITTT